MHKIYSAFAVILPVALGLGLEYLYIMDRLSGAAVFTMIVVMLILIVGVPAVVRWGRDNAIERDRYDNLDVLR